MLGFAALSPAYELDADSSVADTMAQGVCHVGDAETLRMGMFENAQADRI